MTMSVAAAHPHVCRSPWPDPEIPDASLPALLLERARLHRDNRAILDAASGRGLSYGELAITAGWFASGLTRRGFGRGDVLALHSANCPEWPVAFLGALSVGGTVACTNPLYTTDELSKLLELSGARLLMTAPPFLTAAREAGVAEAVVFSDLLASEPIPPEVRIDPAADVAALLYSSGTSGLPKAVELTHRNLISNVLQMSAGVPFEPGDRVLAVAPFFHAMGLVGILLSSLYQGATVVSMPRFEVEPFLAAIQDHAITHVIVPPVVGHLLAAHPMVDDYDLSSLRVLGMGSAPASAKLEEACAK